MEKIVNNNLYINIERGKEVKVSEVIYLFALTIFLIYSILQTTMFWVYMSEEINLLIRVTTISLILIKIIYCDNYSVKQLTSIIILSIITIGSFFQSKYGILIDTIFLIIGAKGISFNKIVRLHIYVSVGIVILAMLGVKIGIIEHIVYYRNGKARYAFGSVYCTDFAARIFYITTSYAYLKNKQIKFKDIVIFTILAWFIYTYCGARLDTISMILVIVSLLVYLLISSIKKDWIEKVKLGFIEKTVLIYSIPICALISFYTTINYSIYNKTMVKLNSILSERLELGLLGIKKYGIKLLGQPVTMKGNGGTTKQITNYFFIDSSYLYIMLCYGLIVLFIVSIYFVCLNKRMINEGNLFFVWAVLIIAINSMVAHHFMDIAYNPFIISFLALIEKNSPSKRLKWK